jgi:hypothetical protein
MTICEIDELLENKPVLCNLGKLLEAVDIQQRAGQS